MDRSEATLLPVSGGSNEGGDQPPVPPRRWSPLFWAIVKFMCLHHHQTVVPPKRICFGCSVDRFRKRSHGSNGASENEERHDADMEPLLVRYEYKDLDTRLVDARRGTGEEGSPLLEQEGACPVCDTLWWNQDGVVEKYTEEEIGIGWWNHRGSGILSSLFLVGALTLVIIDIVNYMDQLWGRPDLILQLMRKTTLYVGLLLYPALVLSSKLRSLLPTSLHNSQWSSPFNVRFLIRRGQFLDIGRKGLPGKLMLFLFLVTPLIAALYRFFIFVVISQCVSDWSTIVTSLVGVIFGQWFGLLVYLLYFTRVSFQREFDLLLIYFRENEGDQTRCRGAFYTTVLDFDCFKQLVNLVIFVLLPLGIFSVSSNLTYEYMFADDACIEVDERNINVAHHTLRLAWMEILFMSCSFLAAVGGLQAEYVFDNFVIRLFHLRSGGHWIFWRSVMRDIAYVGDNHSHFLLVTTAFSFVSLFMAFNFANQDVADLAVCNDTLHVDLCV